MPNPEIRTLLKLQSTQFVGEVRKVRNLVSGFGRDVANLGKLIAGAFVIRQASRLIRDIAATSDELAKMSQRTGFAVETLNGLTQAARLADVSQEQLAVGLFQLNKNLLDATRGTGEAKVSFEAMGIGAEEAGKLLKSPEEAFLTIADRLAGIPDPSRRAAEAMRIFGESGARLLPLLNQGREAIAAQIAEMQKLRPITAEQAKAAEEFNDALTKLGFAAQGLANIIGGKLFPVMTDFIDSLTELTSGDFGTFLEKIQFFLSGDFSKAEKINALLEERAFILKRIAQLEQTPQTRSFFGFDLSTGRDDKLALDRKKLADLNRQLEALREKPKSNKSGEELLDFFGPTEEEVRKQREFLFLRARNAEVQGPTQAEVEEQVRFQARQQEALGRGIVERGAQQFQLKTRDLKLIADEAAFQAEINEEFGYQIEAIEAKINLRKAELELAGKSLETDKELLRLQKDQNDLLGARQEVLGRQIVERSSREFAADQARRLQPFQKAVRDAQLQVDLGERLPNQLDETNRLRRIELIEKTIELLDEERRVGAISAEEYGRQFLLADADLRRELSTTQATFSDGWRSAFTQFANDSTGAFGLGQTVARNFATSVQTLISQQMVTAFDQLESKTRSWQQLLDSTIDTVKRLVAQMISAVAVQAALSAVGGGLSGGPIGILAAQSRGSSNPSLFGPGFASGGAFVVGGVPGVDNNLVRFRATRGEEVQILTPEQQRARNQGASVQVVINNNVPGAEVQTRSVPGSGRTPQQFIIDVVSDSVRRGELGRTLGSTFGLGRTGRVG